MKRIMIISIIGLIWVTANAGNILNENMIVSILRPGYDTTGGVIRKPMDIWAYDRLTGQDTQIGTIDLQQFNIPYTLGMHLFITDWKRDRLIIAGTRQVLKPDYLILNLNDMSISDLKSDTLESRYHGYLYIDPTCDYLILMGTDENDENFERNGFGPGQREPGPRGG